MAIFASLLAFIVSPIGRVIGVAAMIALAFGAGDLRGHRLSDEQCRIAAQKAKDAADLQDKTAKQEVDTQDNAVTAELKAQKVKDDQTIADLLARVTEPPPSTPAAINPVAPNKGAGVVFAPCLYGVDGSVPSGLRNDAGSGASHPTNSRPSLLSKPRTKSGS